MKCRIILELLAILFFTGCYNREQISRLDEAEALIQNKPDSALTILQQLKSEGSQAEQAKYALLYSEALDKNHIKVTNDSLIRQAWSHYKHHPKDLRRQCKTKPVPQACRSATGNQKGRKSADKKARTKKFSPAFYPPHGNKQSLPPAPAEEAIHSFPHSSNGTKLNI